MVPPNFTRSVNPISTRAPAGGGTDYAHQIILASPDFQTFLQPCWSVVPKYTECKHQKILEEYVRKVRSSLKKTCFKENMCDTCHMSLFVTTVFIFASRVASKQSLSIQSTEFVQILRNTTNLCNLKLD